VVRGGEPVDFGTLPDLYISEAIGSNDFGQIVGISFRPDVSDVNRAFLYRDGRLEDLNDLVEPSDWIMERATDINDRGQIVAVARNDVLGTRAAFLLDPMP
jgi:probable HAF family extracellular repeat protein